MPSTQLSFTQLSLSTSVCVVPARAQLLFVAWRERCEDWPLALATEARLPLAVQRELFAAAASAGTPFRQLAHPRVQLNGRRLPSPISAAADERRAASQTIRETLRLAEELGISRVWFEPWRVSLRWSPDRLARLFALDLPLPLEQLQLQRNSLAQSALDGLKSAIDPVLGVADAAGIQLIFSAPPVWPHQLPDREEIAALQREFAGAPLRCGYRPDWQHIAEQTGTADPAAATSAPGQSASPLILDFTAALSADDDAASDSRGTRAVAGELHRDLRVADAAGLVHNLPIGCGEIDWARALRHVAAEAEMVLDFDEETSATELQHSIDVLQAHLPTADPDPLA